MLFLVLFCLVGNCIFLGYAFFLPSAEVGPGIKWVCTIVGVTATVVAALISTTLISWLGVEAISGYPTLQACLLISLASFFFGGVLDGQRETAEIKQEGDSEEYLRLVD